MTNCMHEPGEPCTQPADPDSPIGRCPECTEKFMVEWRQIAARDAARDAERARRAPVDAVLLMGAWQRNDPEAAQVIAANCDIWSVLIETIRFLFTTFRQFDVDIDDRLDVWLSAVRQQLGEGGDPR